MKFIRPNEIPKATLQSEIYHYCRSHGIVACAGYKMPNGDDNLVIVKGDEIVLCIEFQDKDFKFSKEYIDRSQRKYDLTNVKTLICNKWSDIKLICNYIHKEIFGNI